MICKRFYREIGKRKQMMFDWKKYGHYGVTFEKKEKIITYKIECTDGIIQIYRHTILEWYYHNGTSRCSKTDIKMEIVWHRQSSISYPMQIEWQQNL